MCTVKVIQWNWSQQPFVPAVPLFLLRSYWIPGRFSPHCLTEAVWGLGVVSYSSLFIAFFIISHSLFLLPCHSSFSPRDAIMRILSPEDKICRYRYKIPAFAFTVLCVFKMYGSCLNFSGVLQNQRNFLSLGNFLKPRNLARSHDVFCLLLVCLHTCEVLQCFASCNTWSLAWNYSALLSYKGWLFSLRCRM